MRRGLSFFASLASALLIIDCVSAGLLQSIRDAAMLKDSLDQNHREGRGLQLDQLPSNQINTELSFFERAKEKSCPPGDFVCIAQKNIKAGVQNEMSNAVVRSVATMMTEMLNTTITKGLFDMIANGRNSEDPKVRQEARAAMDMATSTMQSVSSKVIKAFSFFVKTSISGVMGDLLRQVVTAARRSSSFNSDDQSSRSYTPLGNIGSTYYSYKTATAPVQPINPSNINNSNNY